MKPLLTSRFLSPEPEVRIEQAFVSPFKNVIATAKTCYSSKGIIQNEEVREGFEDLARSIYQAGHHTTFQHAHFQFALSNVSRQFIWSFLHSHPFYNSEQVSQRYVAVKPGNALIPPLAGESLVIYERTLDSQMEAYRKLVDLLIPVVEADYARRYRKTLRNERRWNSTVKKKSQEVARYVLPIATFAYLYHTISGITLLRYYRLCDQYDTPFEQRMVVGKMIDALLEYDPLYRTILEEPLDLEATPEAQFYRSHQPAGLEGFRPSFLEEFDRSLDGHVSKLIDYKAHNEAVLASAVREVLGVPTLAMPNEAAINLVMSPDQNRLLGESLNLTTLSKLSRTMVHPSYTFRKKMSHTADSQNQRHRMTPGSRPCLAAHLSSVPDYSTPELFFHCEEAKRLYDGTMAMTWEQIGKLRRNGVPDEFAAYLLPNAVSIRFTESADLLNLHHKHAMRLCYNAQEEIWKASLDEALQIREINPLIGKYLLPPCTLRKMAHTSPVCPEGDRYCGVRVWTLDLSQYHRVI